MTMQELKETEKVMIWLKNQIETGDREGWGYDLYSLKVTMSMIENEIKMKEG